MKKYLLSKYVTLKKSDSTKKIIDNFFSLTIIQGTNFLLPLIVLPYLIRIIGVENFGLVSFAQAFMSYFSIFTDYGFNLTSTRNIAIHKNDKDKLSQIASTTYITKFILCAISFLIVFLLVHFISKLTIHSNLYFWALLLILGQTLIPTWFFQGMEQMRFLTYINLVSKIIFTVLIFILIRKPENFIYVAGFYSFGNIISGIVGLFIMKKQFNIRFYWPKEYNIFYEFKNGFYIFLSNFSINIYTNSCLFILGLFASNLIVGYYSIADKVISVFRQLINIFFQATYPQACKFANNSFNDLKKFFYNYYSLFLILVFILSVFIFILAGQICYLLSGKHIIDIVFYIRLLSILPLIICLNIPAYQTIMAYNFQKSFMTVLVIGSSLSLLLNILLTKYLFATGTALSIIFTEMFITVGLHGIIFFKHNNYSLFSKEKWS